jgi:uncharacterized protein (DUF4415 family)
LQARDVPTNKRFLSPGVHDFNPGPAQNNDFRKAKRGAVVSVPKGKTRITIRLDDEILAWFRDQVELAGGDNYQTVINEVLRQHMQRAQEPLERTLRRVIREEVRRAS